MAVITKNLFTKHKDDSITCLACQRQCSLSLGKIGFCRARKNVTGSLHLLTENILSGSPQADPIEKKPLYHFLPGTKTLSIGSFGCNFRCKKCLNWWCSWGEPAGEILDQLAKNKPPRLFKLTPNQIVTRCLNSNLPSLSFTYNEPTIGVEFATQVAKQARKNKIKTIFVTNGSWTKKALDLIGPYLDAANIDFKAFTEKTALKIGSFFKQIPQMAKYAQEKYQIHLELTTVLMPGINDSVDELTRMTYWIGKNLGDQTPWHLSAFSPQLAPDKVFQKIPAPTKKQLVATAKIGQKQGLKHVYIWAPALGFSQ
ncbi:radical SAM protein, partial [Patescibacteria group bacterium]|nr:radical SAM protein [Patescibacteria group bacterium]